MRVGCADRFVEGLAVDEVAEVAGQGLGLPADIAGLGQAGAGLGVLPSESPDADDGHVQPVHEDERHLSRILSRLVMCSGRQSSRRSAQSPPRAGSARPPASAIWDLSFSISKLVTSGGSELHHRTVHSSPIRVENLLRSSLCASSRVTIRPNCPLSCVFWLVSLTSFLANLSVPDSAQRV